MGLCCTVARHVVSKNKRRTVDKKVFGGAVDLDLVQIHKHIICMGLPAQGLESWYRNRYKDVLRYLDYKYGENYMVYNLCEEPKHRYELNFFYGRVREYPFPDHHACPLEMIPRFVDDVLSFIFREDVQRDSVAVIHCKAGKGRTGLLACCLLIAIEPSIQGLAHNAIHYYGFQRTYNGRGLTIPSQIRYVEYYEKLRREHGGQVPLDVPTIHIKAFGLCGIEEKVKITSCKWCAFDKKCVIPLDSSCADNVKVTKTTFYTTNVDVSCHEFFKKLSKDIYVKFFNGNDIVGSLSFHTLFVQEIYNYSVLDKIYKLRLRKDACFFLKFSFAPTMS